MADPFIFPAHLANLEQSSGSGDLVSIERLGCIADGTNAHAAANRAAIQAEIDKGTPLYVPARPQMFVVDDQLVAAGGGYGLTIEGDRAGGVAATNPRVYSAIQMRFSSGNIDNPVIRIPTGVQAEHVRICKLCVDGNRYSGQIGIGGGILFEDYGSSSGEETEGVIEDVLIRRTRGDGLYVGQYRRSLKLHRVTCLYNAQAGFDLRGSDIMGSNLTAGNSGIYGFQFAGVVGRFYAIDCFHNPKGVFIATDENQLTLVGFGIDRNNEEGIYVKAGAYGVTFLGGALHSNSYTTPGFPHVTVESGGEVTFDGTVFAILDTDATNTPTYAISVAAGGRALLSNESYYSPDDGVRQSATAFTDNWAGIVRATSPNLGNGPVSKTTTAGVIFTGAAGEAGSAGQTTLTDGLFYASYFTADEPLVVTKLGCFVGSTAAVGTTLAKFGLFRIEDNGDATFLAAATEGTVANAFATTNAAYELPLDAAVPSVKLRRGQRYAVGVVGKFTTTAPQIIRVSVPIGFNNNFKGRRLCRYKSGLTTLPTGTGPGTVALANSDANWKSDTSSDPLLYAATA